MKRCPECRRDYYDDSLLYCLDDGTALLEGPASGEEPATAIFKESALPYEERAVSSGERAPQASAASSADYVVNGFKGQKWRFFVVLSVIAVVLAGVGLGLYKFFGRDGSARSV